MQCDNATPSGGPKPVTESKLSESERTALRDNLFPRAWRQIDELPAAAWHRDGAKALTAVRLHSSQALAIDVFGTVKELASRSAIGAAWAQQLKLASFGPLDITLEHPVPPGLLREPRSTQIDVLITGEERSAVLECKFTEADGGHCSQTGMREMSNGDRVRQCDGSYHPQVNPLNGKSARCALTAKGIAYWDWIPKILHVEPGEDYSPCPFAGGMYQWMRNAVTAAAMSEQSGRPTAFILVYADGPFPAAASTQGGSWHKFTSLLNDLPDVRHVTFQSLIRTAIEAASAKDAETLLSLEQWVNRKVGGAAKTRP